MASTLPTQNPQTRTDHLVMRLTFEQSPLATFIIDPGMMIIDVNQAALPLLGPAETVLGRSLVTVVGSRWSLTMTRRLVEKVERVLASGVRARPGEWRAARSESASDDVFCIELRPLAHAGAVLGVMCTVSEITRQVRDRANGRRAEAAARTRILELERSNESLSHFAGMVSHDLQEPLRMISSYVALLDRRAQGRLDEATMGYLAQIKRGSSRLHAMISAILSYSSIGATISMEEIPSMTVLQETLEHLSERIQSTQSVIIHDELPVVHADRTLLLVLFQNLLSNAMKFCRGRTPRIHIASVSGPNDWVFSISDNGIGIPSELIPKLFGLFQRLHSEEEFPGTGIGLATCRKILERWGGRIWIESTVGDGSIFYFSIPKPGSKEQGGPCP